MCKKRGKGPNLRQKREFFIGSKREAACAFFFSSVLTWIGEQRGRPFLTTKKDISFPVKEEILYYTTGKRPVPKTGEMDVTDVPWDVTVSVSFLEFELTSWSECLSH